jgi:hypothetical protein
LPLLGWGPAVLCGVGVLFPFPPFVAGDDDTVWPEGFVADVDAVPVPPLPAEFELDDPPHAASSNTSEPSPVAAAHPPLCIISLLHHWHR